MYDVAEQGGDSVCSRVEIVVVVRDELGLHARPAARLTEAAQRFSSRITLSLDDMTADAKSILDILSLAAGRGTSLTLRCEGPDAHEAGRELEHFFGGAAEGE